MKHSRKAAVPEEKQALVPEPRRTSRTHKPPKNDDYFMEGAHLDEVFGSGYQEEDYYPKRRRKNHRYDDSDDYEDGHRPTRRNPQAHLNQVEALLEWKRTPRLLPLTINGLTEEDLQLATEDYCRLKTTKNVAQENLTAVVEQVEAIFINIDWGRPGQTMRQFQQLKLQSNKLMAKGLVFVWAPKEHISQLLIAMERKDFVYVENLEIIKLDLKKAIEFVDSTKKIKFEEGTKDIWPIVKQLNQVSPCDLISNEPSQFFNRSKQTLLMFKKNNSLKLQLRHQRTCDVVFDMPFDLHSKCDPDIKGYIYNMIETLLPDCLNIFQTGKKGIAFKMLELWGDAKELRRGWVTIAQP